MSKKSVEYLNLIAQSARHLSNTSQAILDAYAIELEKAKTDSLKYVEADRILKEKKRSLMAAASEKLAVQQRQYRDAVTTQVGFLKDDLEASLTTKPLNSFMEMLSPYFTYQIAPSKTELECLLQKNGGISLGLRALNRLLEVSGSPFKIIFPASDEFERDLEKLERLANLLPVPAKHSNDFLSIMHIADSESLTDEDKDELTSALLRSRQFWSIVEEIPSSMIERWSTSVTPRIEHFQNEVTEGQVVSPAEQHAVAMSNIDKGKIEAVPVSLGSQLGEEKVTQLKRAKEIMASKR